MAEVLVAFTTVVATEDGRRFEPRACGGLTDDGMYEGWIEFVPTSGSGEPARTPRETLQPNRADLVYWAMGLTQTYLDGALRRALTKRPVVAEQERSVPVTFEGPATHRADRATRPPHAVLNPYDVYQQGESVLVAELGALSTGHLRDIVLAYGFATPQAAERASARELTRMVMDGVRNPRQVAEGPRAES